MSLRHETLALLTIEPMTGYELAKLLDDTLGLLWAAPHSQIYPELRKMEDSGFIEAERVPRGARAEKRVYTITKLGVEELQRWEQEPQSYPPERDVHRLKAAYFEFSSPEAARTHLNSHLTYWTRRADLWTELLEGIRTRTYPLLRRRLDRFPPETHDAIVAFKGLAFEGQLARAHAEIDWAKRSLAALEQLGDLAAVQAVTAEAAKGHASR